MLNKSLNLSFLWLVYRTKKTSAQSQLHKYNATKFLSSDILIFERRYILLIKEQANFRLGNYFRFYMPWDLFPLLYAFFDFWGYMMHLISNSTNFSCSTSSFCQMIRTCYKDDMYSLLSVNLSHLCQISGYLKLASGRHLHFWYSYCGPYFC